MYWIWIILTSWNKYLLERVLGLVAKGTDRITVECTILVSICNVKQVWDTRIAYPAVFVSAINVPFLMLHGSKLICSDPTCPPSNVPPHNSWISRKPDKCWGLKMEMDYVYTCMAYERQPTTKLCSSLALNIPSPWWSWYLRVMICLIL